MGQLVNTIQDEVIPRLVLAKRASHHSVHENVTSESRAADQFVEEFANLLLAHEVEIAYAFIDSVRARGVPLQTIYLELLAPAARHLGALWEEDRCGFADVTVALCRLHEVLRGLGHGFRIETDSSASGRRVLLAPAPGEQHTFGLLMVADFFRRAGWEVWTETLIGASEMLALVRREWFAIVGLSVGCDVNLDGLASSVHAVRKAARNRSLGVMVGGSLFSKQPELAIQVGADATATDGSHAALQAEHVVSMLATRC